MSFRLPVQISRAVNLASQPRNIERAVHHSNALVRRNRDHFASHASAGSSTPRPLASGAISQPVNAEWSVEECSEISPRRTVTPRTSEKKAQPSSERPKSSKLPVQVSQRDQEERNRMQKMSKEVTARMEELRRKLRVSKWPERDMSHLQPCLMRPLPDYRNVLRQGYPDNMIEIQDVPPYRRSLSASVAESQTTRSQATDTEPKRSKLFGAHSSKAQARRSFSTSVADKPKIIYEEMFLQRTLSLSPIRRPHTANPLVNCCTESEVHTESEVEEDTLNRRAHRNYRNQGLLQRDVSSTGGQRSYSTAAALPKLPVPKQACAMVWQQQQFQKHTKCPEKDCNIPHREHCEDHEPLKPSRSLTFRKTTREECEMCIRDDVPPPEQPELKKLKARYDQSLMTFPRPPTPTGKFAIAKRMDDVLCWRPRPKKLPSIRNACEYSTMVQRSSSDSQGNASTDSAREHTATDNARRRTITFDQLDVAVRTFLRRLYYVPRLRRFSTDSSLQTMSVRYMSTKSKCGPTMSESTTKKEKPCPRMKLPFCAPAVCGERPGADCKKVESPFPAFSQIYDDWKEPELTECLDYNLRMLQPYYQFESYYESIPPPPPAFVFVNCRDEKRCVKKLQQQAKNSAALAGFVEQQLSADPSACPRMTIDGCPPPARPDCKLNEIHYECTKIPAPYESFADKRPDYYDPEITELLVQEDMYKAQIQSTGILPGPPPTIIPRDESCKLGRYQAPIPTCDGRKSMPTETSTGSDKHEEECPEEEFETPRDCGSKGEASASSVHDDPCRSKQTAPAVPVTPCPPPPYTPKPKTVTPPREASAAEKKCEAVSSPSKDKEDPCATKKAESDQPKPTGCGSKKSNKQKPAKKKSSKKCGQKKKNKSKSKCASKSTGKTETKKLCEKKDSEKKSGDCGPKECSPGKITAKVSPEYQQKMKDVPLSCRTASHTKMGPTFVFDGDGGKSSIKTSKSSGCGKIKKKPLEHKNAGPVCKKNEKPNAKQNCSSSKDDKNGKLQYSGPKISEDDQNDCGTCKSTKKSDSNKKGKKKILDSSKNNKNSKSYHTGRAIYSNIKNSKPTYNTNRKSKLTRCARTRSKRITKDQKKSGSVRVQYVPVSQKVCENCTCPLELPLSICYDNFNNLSNNTNTITGSCVRFYPAFSSDYAGVLQKHSNILKNRTHPSSVAALSQAFYSQITQAKSTEGKVSEVHKLKSASTSKDKPKNEDKCKPKEAKKPAKDETLNKCKPKDGNKPAKPENQSTLVCGKKPETVIPSKPSTSKCGSSAPISCACKAAFPCAPKKSADKISLSSQKSLLQKICDYFKARPDCPPPDEWKKKLLREKAEKAAAKAGLVICDPKPTGTSPCKPKGKIPSCVDLCKNPKCPPLAPHATKKKKSAVMKGNKKNSKKTTKKQCKKTYCTSSIHRQTVVEQTRKYSTKVSGINLRDTRLKTEVQLNSSSDFNHLTSRNDTQYIGKMYRLRLSRIGIRNPLIPHQPPKDQTHTVCYMCKLVPKSKVRRFSVQSNVNKSVHRRRSQEIPRNKV